MPFSIQRILVPTRFLLGCITARVMRRAPCSVMVVRTPEPAHEA